ncbi:MAG: hypothetical protein NUW37_04460 [Planctomycetes bacterium]|nr:hypothetical protein [Planctomycetota bacterium]
MAGLEPHEIVYRRLPFELFEPSTNTVTIRGFHPIENDTYGISLYRSKFCTATEVGSWGRRADKEYWVAELIVSDILSLGLTVEVDDPEDPRHVQIPELRRFPELKLSKGDLRKKKIERALAEYERGLAGIVKCVHPAVNGGVLIPPFQYEP